jgi:hypothetical protein
MLYHVDITTIKNVLRVSVFGVRHLRLRPVILATWEAETSEDCGYKQVWANSSKDPISKITRAKWTGGVWIAVQGNMFYSNR